MQDMIDLGQELQGLTLLFSIDLRMPQRFSVTFLLTLFGVSLAYPMGTPPTVQVGFLLKATADSNVFLQSSDTLASGQVGPALPTHAHDFVFSASPSLSLVWRSSAESSLETRYAPEIVRFGRYRSENHEDHRFNLAWVGRTADWRGEFRGSVVVTDGSRESPVFNRLGGAPSIGGEPVRARRAQDIYKFSARVVHPARHGFVRGVMDVCQQDFHTTERTSSGYANYVDRGESSVGTDAGWYVRNGFALVAGVRGGQQNQATLHDNPLHYSNTLVRWLAGCEGTPLRNLKVSLLAGPDHRHYGGVVAAGFNRERDTLYGEGRIIWTPGADDTLTLSGKRYAWVSSGGRGAYVDLVADVTWQHHLNSAWTVLAGFCHHAGDSRPYNSVSPRNDVIECARATLTRQLGALTLEAAWSHEWSRTAIPNTPGRAYRRDLLSVGAFRRW